MKKTNRILGLSLTALSAAFLMMAGSNALADQVVSDDQIILGSQCVGLDCVNGESFGFDTIRLKENNVRIHFLDTSVSASFPGNDWMLVANDSSNGGLNQFSVQDVTGNRVPFLIEAGAPNSTLYVEADGDVGIKTANPVVDLHIVEGNTPTVRLEQDGSDGFSPQTFDIAANETNFFIRDATNGSSLAFRIKPGSGTSNAIVIDADGDVGFGTDTPDAELEVSDLSDNIDLLLHYKDGGYSELRFKENNVDLWSTGSSGFTGFEYFYIFNYPRNATDLAINETDGYLGLGGVTNATSPIQHMNGASLSTTGIWTNASSRDLKHDIQGISAEDALNALNDLQPVTFHYNLDPSDQVAGFIAEDVPEIMATPDRKGLSSMDVVAVLTKVVQEQQASIERLEKELSKVVR